ncbi:hypothetical protein DE146DRAFT_687427 [Phaeosphaeria sp. MPI-PUGE-AT-0046c]|nr:hypothetical protein DE146DRAFT_687427 [Phaeosphaeria sp. MPI-PUGE-AT-0046c]
MSDHDNTAGGVTAQFTDRELQMLGWAMQSLKTGPPEIDYEKLAGFAGMGNPRSASNAWAKIKNKLAAPNPDGSSPAPTPKKTGGRKKAVAAPANGEDDEPATPKKTPRKRAAKKQEVGGDASPKKKGRATKKEEEANKDESDQADSAVVTVKDEAAEEDTVETEV